VPFRPADQIEGTRVLVRHRWRGLLSIVLAAGLGGLVTAPALAEHEPQYRYTVLGYVKDAAGNPRKGVGLEVIRQKTGFAYVGETDASGLYVIVTRPRRRKSQRSPPRARGTGQSHDRRAL
jgi:hypothetical protein